MIHYLFECTDSNSKYKGKEFIVGANSLDEAKEIANDNFGKTMFICEMTEYEVEESDLDVYDN